jgi:uncharacterized damage-inducible protein DinB
MHAKSALLAELDQELAATRRLLERVPAASLEWRPHARSFSLGGLATHLAQLPHWGAQILDRDAYDLASATGQRRPNATLDEVLATFDQHVAELRRGLVGREEAELMTLWSLKRGKETLLSTPRISALRRFMLHHLIHHRGQLTVYLRMLDVPLLPIYGPTADENP